MNFSVIIPTYNRCLSLQQTVESVLKVDYDDFEIIIVNDGSSDATAEYLNGLSQHHRIKCLSQKNQGPAAARNAGLRIASGEWIAFTDDDCKVPTNWLRRFEEEFRATFPDIVGGNVRNCCEKNFLSELSQEMSTYYVEYLRLRGRDEFLTSNNIAYNSVAINAVGGFDERFTRPGGEERALNYHIISRGGKSVFLRDHFVEHFHSMTVGKFIRQQQNYGRGSFILHHLAGNGRDSEIAIPPDAYVALMLSWAKDNGFRGILKCVIFAVAQMAMISGYLRETFSRQYA
jgi:glycosyltransferase involved in cell wall biosynthesis